MPASPVRGNCRRPGKSASLDEFVRRTNQVEINFDSDHTVLAKRQAEPDDYPVELPEGVLLSRGETGEIGSLLREIGSPLTPIEVDSYILDCCYARELDFEEFFARAFGREKLKFVRRGTAGRLLQLHRRTLRRS